MRYIYYTLKTRAKQGENVYKEFLQLGLEIGQIDWYNKAINNYAGEGSAL